MLLNFHCSNLLLPQVLGGVLAIGLLSGAAAAETTQQSCTFDHVAKVTGEGMQRADVSWRVLAAHKRRSGRVIVYGSGDYKARAKTFENGAVEYVFKTRVSKETMTISPRGEALWEIKFKNGDYMVYVGTCGTEEVVS